MCTSGYSSCTRSIPSGAATRQTSVTVRAPGVLDLLDRRDARVAGGEHRVEDDRVALGEVGRQLHEVLDRLERLLVAVHADEPDARARDERERRRRASRRRRGAPGRRRPSCPRSAEPSALERRLDLDRLGRKVLRRLVGEEQRHLLDELAEVDGRRVLVAQVRQLVLHERVGDVREPVAVALTSSYVV